MKKLLGMINSNPKIKIDENLTLYCKYDIILTSKQKTIIETVMLLYEDL